MEDKIDLDTLITKNPQLMSSDIDGEIVMLNVESGKYFGLDPIGSRIWELLETPQSATELCNVLIGEFDVEIERCRHEVLFFLNKLLKKNVIRIKNE